MIARRFTLICLASALAGTLLAGIVAEAGRAPRPWQSLSCAPADACAAFR